MSRDQNEFGVVSSLGSEKTVYKDTYSPDVLEWFINKHQNNDYWVRLNCLEFSSLCPKTGQPDWAKITINYIPNEKMVESKSLKLYLFSFRNHGDFHEDVINIIAKDLFKLMEPKYIEVYGEFNSRGGISIHPFVVLTNNTEEFELIRRRRMENFERVV